MSSNALERLSGQLLVIGFQGSTLPASVARALGEGALGGVILFKRNLADLDMPGVAALCESIARATSGDPPLISVDQEGGRVARLGEPAMKLPAMLSLEKKDESLLEALACAQATELRALGLTMSFAPVLDVHSNERNPVIGDRAFGRDAPSAARKALRFAAGMRRAGLLSCGKHFPGHGDTSQDSHLELPVVPHERARLDAVELLPFVEAARAGVDAMMTAHVVYPALDPLPATIARAIATDLLRGRLGFRGVLFSDDLEMKALASRMTYAESAVAAIVAGCDALLVCSSEAAWQEAREAIAREAERSSAFRARCEEALTRFSAMRRRAAPAPLADREALLALFDKAETRALEARAWEADA